MPATRRRLNIEYLLSNGLGAKGHFSARHDRLDVSSAGCNEVGGEGVRAAAMLGPG
jgi:hypothetical protein